MKSKLDKAIEYIRGYCSKHGSCLDCKLNDDSKQDCILSKTIPCDWETQKERQDHEKNN